MLPRMGGESMDEQLLTVGETGRLLGVSPRRVKQLEDEEQRLSSQRTATGWRPYRRRDVEALARERAAARQRRGAA
jgi:DNA-binding transcriptional MerR regulator